MNDETIISKPLVLVVDDVQDNLVIASAMLKKNGYDVKTATSGESALELLKEIKPDLILLDIMMPGIKGYEVCEKIKANPDIKDIPVIFLTSLSETPDIVKGFQSGAADYVTKPFNSAELAARVKTHTELKKSRDALVDYTIKLQRANEQLTKAHQELKELNASKDKFFSIIAHDLKNPFQGLLGLSEVLIENAELLSHEEIISSMKEVNNAAQTLFKLLENLLHWSRIQLGRLEYKPENINLKNLVDNEFIALKGLAAQKQILISNNIPDDVLVYVDSNMIATVLRNLISNAIKFTHPGGSVTVSTVNLMQNVLVQVSDTGIGMTRDEIQKLFKIDVQFTKHGTSNETGTGLGLILCKELVEKNKGKIEVDSEPGKGTLFTITLPKHFEN